MEQNFTELVVGGVYKNRDGGLVTIRSHRCIPPLPYEFISVCDGSYTKSGQFNIHQTNHYQDLVEFVGMHTVQKSQNPKPYVIIKLPNGNLVKYENLDSIPFGVEFNIHQG